MVQPGRYRHYKGQEYEVLGVPGTQKQKRNMWSIVLSMATAGYGLGLGPCFRKWYSLMVVLVHGSSFLLSPRSHLRP